jgi:hypothetical protein
MLMLSHPYLLHIDPPQGRVCAACSRRLVVEGCGCRRFKAQTVLQPGNGARMEVLTLDKARQKYPW